MKINELKKVSYSELQQYYSRFLKAKGLSKNTIASYKYNAFYIQRNRSDIDFWGLLLSDNFEERAKRLLYKILTDKSSKNPEVHLRFYLSHIKRLREFVFLYKDLQQSDKTVYLKEKMKKKPEIPRPCRKEVEFFLKEWSKKENYYFQEQALNKLFWEYAPHNTQLEDILIKVAALNDFYSTNIFSVYPVAKHILSLDIDQRLQKGDISLVDELQKVEIGGKIKHFYSFATKYCSHHVPDHFPIYDSYVENILVYFRDKDSFAIFTANDLKNYKRFKEVLIQFRNFYSLSEYSLKQLDQYLWQLGKNYFPKKFKDKAPNSK